MKVITNFESNYWEEQSRYFKFEDYEDIAKDCLLFVGAWPDNSIYNEADIPKYFLSTEEQIWDRDSTDNYIPYVEKILTITSPSLTGRANREYVFIPIHDDLIPPRSEKIYDVVYSGFALMPHVNDIIRTIRNFNYCLISFDFFGGLTTHQNVTFKRKLELIAQSKCCVVHNMLGNGTPQLKSRAFEASFSQSLMLVMKDNFNFIVDWFVPDVDFLYYSSPQELNDLILECSDNFGEYEYIIQNAYEKAINNYTSKKFIERYIGLK